MQQCQLQFRLVVAEHPFADHLAEQPSRDDVEIRVVLDVLDRGADGGLVKLLGGDAVEQGDFHFGGHLHGFRDIVGEAMRRPQDRQVDPIGVVRLASAVAFGDVDPVLHRRLGAGLGLRDGHGGFLASGRVKVSAKTHGCNLKTQHVVVAITTDH